MAYHDDLLTQAVRLANEDALNPKQANLRRGVSSAYYAVFHLLIAEAASNWARPHLQTALARAFDHGLMKTASQALVNSRAFPFQGENPAVVA